MSKKKCSGTCDGNVIENGTNNKLGRRMGNVMKHDGFGLYFLPKVGCKMRRKPSKEKGRTREGPFLGNGCPRVSPILELVTE